MSEFFNQLPREPLYSLLAERHGDLAREARLTGDELSLPYYWNTACYFEDLRELCESVRREPNHSCFAAGFIRAAVYRYRQIGHELSLGFKTDRLGGGLTDPGEDHRAVIGDSFSNGWFFSGLPRQDLLVGIIGPQGFAAASAGVFEEREFHRKSLNLAGMIVNGGIDPYISSLGEPKPPFWRALLGSNSEIFALVGVAFERAKKRFLELNGNKPRSSILPVSVIFTGADFLSDEFAEGGSGDIELLQRLIIESTMDLVPAEICGVRTRVAPLIGCNCGFTFPEKELVEINYVPDSGPGSGKGLRLAVEKGKIPDRVWYSKILDDVMSIANDPQPYVAA